MNVINTTIVNPGFFRTELLTEQKIADLKAQIEANRDLSTSLAFD